jgi:hypothetical protein
MMMRDAIMAELLEIEALLQDDRLNDDDRHALHGAQQALRHVLEADTWHPAASSRIKVIAGRSGPGSVPQPGPFQRPGPRLSWGMTKRLVPSLSEPRGREVPRGRSSVSRAMRFHDKMRTPIGFPLSSLTITLGETNAV